MNKRVIWKYPFNTDDVLEIYMPAGARVLTVQMQNDLPCLWAILDPNEPPKCQRFRIYGTGHAIEENADRYVGTYQQAGGDLVWHVFEVID